MKKSIGSQSEFFSESDDSGMRKNSKFRLMRKKGKRKLSKTYGKYNFRSGIKTKQFKVPVDTIDFLFTLNMFSFHIFIV